MLTAISKAVFILQKGKEKKLYPEKYPFTSVTLNRTILAKGTKKIQAL